MRLIFKITLVTLGVLIAMVSLADTSIIGKVRRIYPSLAGNVVYVDLQGLPQLDGGGCPLYVFVGRMDDVNFKTFVYSALLAAKTADADIKIIVQGCQGAYPLISGVEYSPAQ
jgi:hypothetical protein